MARKAPAPAKPGQRIDGDLLLQAMAARIRSLRIARDLTQEEFAQRAGISVSFVSMIERGERSPSYETLHQLADGLDLHVADLFRDGAADVPGRQIEPLLDLMQTVRLNRLQVEKLVKVARALFGLDGPDPRPTTVTPGGKICSLGGCGRPLLAKGLCASHYHAQRRQAGRDVRSSKA